MATKYIEGVGDTTTTAAAVVTQLKADDTRHTPFVYDLVNGVMKFYDRVNSAVRQLVTLDGTEVLTNKTLTAPVLTTPTISSPVLSGAGVMQVAVVDLAGAAWHTGNGTADYLSWTPTADCVIARVVVNIVTGATGAATTDIGTSTVDNHTNGDNLIDGANIQTVGAISNFVLAALDTEKAQVALASGKFLNFHALADPTGLVGKAYIYYFTL